jgi:hypothetical protein
MHEWLLSNSKFSLQSEDERELCARTIYCTNIDKKVKIRFVRKIIAGQLSLVV